MPTYYGLKTVFVHIPKCAGSGMAQRLFSENKKLNALSQEYDKHESAYLIANSMRYDLYLEFYKFGFVRNPFDRMVSWFHYYQNLWETSKEKPCSEKCIDSFKKMNFEEWVKRLQPYEAGGCRSETACPFHFIANQYEYLIWKDGKIFVDFIGRFEEIDKDWSVVCERIGIEKSKLKISNKSERKEYKEYYTEETKSIITKQYSKDLDFFKYCF